MFSFGTDAASRGLSLCTFFPMTFAGLLSPPGWKKPDAATADQFELPPPLPWEEHFDASESDEDESLSSYTAPSSPPWSHVVPNNENAEYEEEEGEEEESERSRRQKKKFTNEPTVLRNKAVERVITGTQPVRRRSPRNLERKMYNYSRNTTARREVNVKETTASIREKRQMESRRRVEAVAKNAELRAKKTRLLRSRVATADEEKDENINDYGPSVTHVVGNFERKRRHVDETRWTLAENKQYITGTQPRKPSKEFVAERSRTMAVTKRNQKRVTSTRKYYGFGSTYTSPPKRARSKIQKRRRGDDFEEEEEEDEEFQHWPPRTTATSSPHLQTASRAKGRAAMEAAKKEAAERRKANNTVKIFNRPIGVARKQTTTTTNDNINNAVANTSNDSGWEQDPNFDVFEFTPESIEFGYGSRQSNMNAAKTPKSNAQKLGASTYPEPFQLATEKRAIINRRQFLKDRRAELERETYALSNKKGTATKRRVVAKTPRRTQAERTKAPAPIALDSSDELIVDVTGRACTTPKPFKLQGAALSERRKNVEKREREQQHVMNTPKIQKSTGLNKKHVSARKGPIRGSRAEDRAVFAEINMENDTNRTAAGARTGTKKESQNLLKSALKAPGTTGRKRRAVTFNK